MKKTIPAPEWLKRRTQAARNQRPFTSAELDRLAQSSTRTRLKLTGKLTG